MLSKIILKELYKPLAIICMLLAEFDFSGCDSLTGSTSVFGDVYGKIYGINNAFLSGYRITVAGRSVTTDNYGRFGFTDVEYPYDLVIFDSIGKKCAFFPGRDSITRDNLSIGILSSSYNMHNSLITVTYPEGIITNSGKLIFSDNADKNLYGDLTSAGGEIELDMSYGTQYRGKLIVLAFTKNSAGRITSYDKYCIKDSIVLNAGINLDISLSTQDFKVNTINKKFRVSLCMLQGQYADIRYAYISFGNQFTYNYLNSIAFETFGTSTFDLIVPGGLGIKCYPIIGFNTKKEAGNVCYSSVFDVPADDITICPPVSPVPVYPPENASVDINTEFTFNQGLSHVDNKFYKLNFFDISGIPTKCLYYDVYLDKERFLISELENLGIESVKGRSFQWSVEVYENITLNDYIRENISGNRRYMTECVKRKVTINP